MIDVLEKNNGQLALKAEVKEILIDKGKAIGVLMKNGDRILAGKVLSNAGVHNTFNHLLPADSRELCASLNEIGSSTAHVCLYLGLDGSDRELNLPRHNFWIYDEYGFDEGYERHLQSPGSKVPLVYISFPSAKDPAWAEKHPGMSTIQVMAACPYKWVERWEESKWKKRGEEYDAFKASYTEQLLEKLFDVVPQARGRIVQQELSSPLSTRHFSNYSRGEIYGMEHTPLRFNNVHLRAHTPYKNLFLAGQDIITVGVGGALFSGVIASTRMLSRNMLWRISRYKPESQTGGKA
jgi:all-trans-retinol 13,14-reductase